MSTYPTPAALATPWSPEAARASRARSVAVALLACVPLPILSLGGMLLPIPELAQRAAATFAPLAPFIETGDERVIRQRVAARPLEITIAADERATGAASSPADGALERARVAGKAASTRPGRDDVVRASAASAPATPAPKASPASPPRAGDPAPAAPEAPGTSDPPPAPPTDGGGAPKSAPTPPTQGTGKEGSGQAGSGTSGSSSGSGSQPGSKDGATTDPGAGTGGGSESGGPGSKGSGGGGGQASNGSPPEHSSGQGKPEAPPEGGGSKGAGKP